jgi:choline/glycine/proline betaine transport protein
MLTTFTVTYFGWFYILSVTGLLGFLIWVALSRYGSIRLSADHEAPEYGTSPGSPCCSPPASAPF